MVRVRLICVKHGYMRYFLYYLYQGQNRHYKFREEKAVSPKNVYQLAAEIQNILSTSSQEMCITVCDGCSYNLQITYTDKQRKVLNRDVYREVFDSLMEKFIHNVFSE